MRCPNVGAKFRSRNLSHMMPNLGVFFLFFCFKVPLRQGDNCAQLYQMDLEKN